MSFTESLKSADENILLAINGNHTPFLDSFMYYISEKWILIPVYILLIYFFQKNYGWRTSLYIIGSALILIALCDLTASQIFKNLIMRNRPSHEPGLQEQLHYVNGYKGGQFGFFSSHAANMTALALYCGYFLKRKVKHYAVLAFTLVFLICLSRIYLGVHYPSDILAGCLAGSIYTLLCIYLFKEYVSPRINLKL